MNRREFIKAIGIGTVGFMISGFSNHPTVDASQPSDSNGACIYCNRCQPCPAGIDIGAINKCLDSANFGDAQAKERYLALSRHASQCIGCGACEPRCAVRVKVREHMQQAVELFGK